MNWAAHLTTVNFGGHDGTESSHIIVCLAHPGSGFVFNFGLNGFGRRFSNGFKSSFMLEVMDGTFSEIDALTVLAAASECDEVADLALKAYVGDEALAGFYVDAWEIARIRITVWVGVLAVVEEEEVVAIVHVFGIVGIKIIKSYAFVGSVSFLVKKSLRWW